VKAKFTLLVAEDSDTDLMLLTHAVAQLGEGVDLQVTRDGDEVIRYLLGTGEFADRERHPFPDLVMLDLKMPRLSGSGVLRWLQGQPDCAHIPRIIMSGSSVMKDVEECYELGANTYFMKPTGLSELRELIGYIVGYWLRSQRLVPHHSCEDSNGKHPART
jgi:CheY-like chemotaxis protein